MVRPSSSAMSCSEVAPYPRCENSLSAAATIACLVRCARSARVVASLRGRAWTTGQRCQLKSSERASGINDESRTLTVAALYGARLRDISVDEALADVCAVLPNAPPDPGVSSDAATASSRRRLHARIDLAHYLTTLIDDASVRPLRLAHPRPPAPLRALI